MKIVSAPKVGPLSGEVRFELKSDIAAEPRDVRYAPRSRHRERGRACRLTAKNGLMTARTGSSKLGVIFASDLVDLLPSHLLWRFAGRIAGFAEKRIQAGRRHNPKQQQFAIWVSEPVPRVLRNKYRSALLDRMPYIVQYERSGPV
jgi:hypothetical protein